MGVSELLLRMREEYLAGKHRIFANVYDHAEGIQSLTDDKNTMARMIFELDKASPGMNFHMYLDGAEIGEAPDGTVEFNYTHERKPAEVAAVMAKAAIWARGAA